jgi:transcriptional regulator with XRE-family HTH domain
MTCRRMIAGMPTKSQKASTTPSSRAWDFLAQVVRERRENIGLSQEEVYEYGGPKKSTVGKIENARETSYSTRTLQQLEEALGWDRGAVDQLLAVADQDDFSAREAEIAHEYVYAPIVGISARRSDEERVASAAELSDEELLAELTFRMRRYSQGQGIAIHQTGSGKTMSFALAHQARLVAEQAAQEDEASSAPRAARDVGPGAGPIGGATRHAMATAGEESQDPGDTEPS